LHDTRHDSGQHAVLDAAFVQGGAHSTAPTGTDRETSFAQKSLKSGVDGRLNGPVYCTHHTRAPQTRTVGSTGDGGRKLLLIGFAGRSWDLTKGAVQRGGLHLGFTLERAREVAERVRVQRVRVRALRRAQTAVAVHEQSAPVCEAAKAALRSE
jgi:hypothetical protein